MKPRDLLSIGIDFGTTFSFCSYLEGDKIRYLIPVTENYGIPSVFYDDGKGHKSYGRIALRRLDNPRTAGNVVTSVKRRLKENGYLLEAGNNKYTASDIIREIVEHMVHDAVKVATENYQIDFTPNFRVEAVVTVPVDFSEADKFLINQAISSIVMPNGTHLVVRTMFPEPVAAAVEYFGARSQADEDILVFDLGGGTLDVAWVHSNKDTSKTAYEVIDQNGDKELGGDDWDKAVAEWLKEQYLKEYPGETFTKLDEAYLRTQAREMKEELSSAEVSVLTLDIHGNDVDVELSRAEFESLTKPLLDRAIAKVEKLVSRRGGKKPNHIVLTGGSSLMPQVNRAISERFAGVDVRNMDPAHAIANGAARYADWLQQTPTAGTGAPQRQTKIKLISSHAYGISYHYDDTDRDEIKILIPRGVQLPYSVNNSSYTRVLNQRTSAFHVFELDSFGKAGTRVPESEGREVLVASLKRPEGRNIPIDTESVETLTLSEAELLSIKAVDDLNGVKVEDSVSLVRKH